MEEEKEVTLLRLKEMIEEFDRDFIVHVELSGKDGDNGRKEK